MGVFGNLFKKQSEPAKLEQQKIEIQVENIEEWIKGLNSEKINSVLSELSGVWEDVVTEIVRLQSSISVLEKAKFEPKDKMYAPVNMIKDRFVTKSKMLNKVPKSIPENFTSIKSTYSEASNLISEFKEADIKQAHVVSVYFKKEAEQIIKSLKTIDSLLSYFDKKLNSDGLVLQVVEEVSTKAEAIKKLKNSVEASEKNKSGLEKQIEDVEGALEKQKTELDRITLDEKWEELKKIKEQAQKVEEEIKKLEHSISEDISSISRPIKKILHESDASVKIDLPEGIENLGLIYSAFKIVDNVMGKSKINLKETEIEKLDNIREKIKSGEFENTKKLYGSLVLKKSNLENDVAELSGIETLKKQKEQETKETQTLLQRLKFEQDDLSKEETKSADAIEKLKGEIKSTVLQKFSVELRVI